MHKISINRYIIIVISFLIGVLGVLSFSPYDLWPCAILSLTGLLIISDHNIKKSILHSFFWGLGLFSAGINWIYISISKFSSLPYQVNIFLMLLLIIYLACYPMIFSVLLGKIWPIFNWQKLIFGAPVLWIIIEYLRGYLLSGFPWLQFGYSQIDGPLKGLAPIFGVQSITFVIMIISGFLAFALVRRHLLSLILFFILILFLYLLSFFNWYSMQPQKSILITLVQGNIDYHIKWDSHKLEEIINTYLIKSMPMIGKAQIIIWPETAIPDFEFNQNAFLLKCDKILRSNNTDLITGILDFNLKKDKYVCYNSIIAFGISYPYNYHHSNRYYKHHLVPCVENISTNYLSKILSIFFDIPFVNIARGDYLQLPLHLGNIKITANICYEIIFGNQIRSNFSNDTDFLLTISNDSWFGHSIGPWQHLQMVRMRALELGRPLLHCTNNGITAVINANGLIIKQLPQFICETLSMNIIPTTGLTPYAIMGYWPLCVLIIINGCLGLFYRK